MDVDGLDVHVAATQGTAVADATAFDGVLPDTLVLPGEAEAHGAAPHPPASGQLRGRRVALTSAPAASRVARVPEPASPPSAGQGAVPARERARRRALLEDLLATVGADHGLLVATSRSPGVVTWLTGWPVTRLAAVLVTPGERDVLWVGYPNHVPNAARLCPQADVRPAGEDLATLVAAELASRGATRVGLAGPCPPDVAAAVGRAGPAVRLDGELARARARKSADEVAVLAASAALTDEAARALFATAQPGASEHDMVAAFHHAVLAAGGGVHIAYLSSTDPSAPDRCAPSQFPTGRRLRDGDVVVVELSAAVEPDYPGQLLRTAVLGPDVPAVVAELHAVAEAVRDAVLAALAPGVAPADLAAVAADLLAQAGLGTLDDLVHGFGGGYLPPVISLAHPSAAPSPDEPVAEGMTLVVQPNVTTPDQQFGVQTGELVWVGPDGAVQLHGYPAGLVRLPGGSPAGTTPAIGGHGDAPAG